MNLKEREYILVLKLQVLPCSHSSYLPDTVRGKSRFLLPLKREFLQLLEGDEELSGVFRIIHSRHLYINNHHF